VRPYVKSDRVGRQVWRGTNAADLSATGEVDLRLGLYGALDSFYLSVRRKIAPFVIASDQLRIALVLCCTLLLDQFMAGEQANENWLVNAVKAMLTVYDRVM